jgi:hypothetical protein
LPVTITLANGGAAPVQTYVPYVSPATLADFIAETSTGRSLELNGFSPPTADLNLNSQAIINLQSFTFVPYFFGTLPTEQDGSIVYCADCSATAVCSGLGSGAMAVGINGQWSCAP